MIFLGPAEKALPFCNQYFRNFLQPDRQSEAAIKISILKNPNRSFPFQSIDPNPVFERLLPTRNVVQWLKTIPAVPQDFPINADTICAYCLGGMLLFNPDRAAGRIYLLEQGGRSFRSLYRLFWMYFAQVLGEKESCFIHCAALVKDKKGYLFLGDSGAGKTTLARACEESIVLSDDSPIFCKQKGVYSVFPSPFHQLDIIQGLNKEVVATRADVQGLYFLVQDDKTYLKKISKKKAISMVIKRHIHFFPYLSAQARSVLFDLFFEVCHTLPVYYLYFRQDQNVWDVIGNP
jgi:hypothetical protein